MQTLSGINGESNKIYRVSYCGDSRFSMFSQKTNQGDNQNNQAASEQLDLEGSVLRV